MGKNFFVVVCTNLRSLFMAETHERSFPDMIRNVDRKVDKNHVFASRYVAFATSKKKALLSFFKSCGGSHPRKPQ